MKLIAEQIKYLRERKKELEEKRKDYKIYLETRDRTGYDDIGVPQFGNFATDSEYGTYLGELSDIYRTLQESEFITERNLNSIDIGTMFQVRFENEEATEELMLVEKGITFGNMKFVSLDSDLGKAVYGRKKSDQLTYTVQATGRTIPITLEDIITMRDKYEHFIRERKLTDRMSDTVKKDLHNLKINNIEEYKNRHAITRSQLELAKEELDKLPKYPKTQNEIGKIGYLKKIINESIIAEPPKDGTIGVGSYAEIMITDEFGEVKELSFEFINAAVSTELESNYVERITPLGNTIFGLRENDTFQVIRKNKPRLKGVVKRVVNINENELKRTR